MKRKVISFVLSLMLIIACIGLSGNSTNAAGGSWQKDSTGWWYQYYGGGYAVGWTYIDGLWYYFTANGYMDYSEYRDGYWLNADGSWNPAYYGGHWASDATGWWYTDYSGWYPTSQWLWIDGSCYYFKADGYMAANQTIDGCYVGYDGAMTAHTHTWETKTINVTETTIVHHDAVTHTEEQSHWVKYTDLGIYELPGCDLDSSECTNPGHHDGCWVCHYCGQTFPTITAINKHYDDIEAQYTANIATHEDLGNGMHRYTYKDPDLEAALSEHLCWGYQGSSGWDDQKLVTETVTVIDQAAWDETIETPVSRTVTMCSECGAIQN